MKHTFIQRKLAGWLQRETSSSGVRRVASLNGALASEIGNIRKDNQDKAIIFRGKDANGRPYAVAVVADGIGGMKDGAICASLAIGSFTSAFSELSLSGKGSPRAWMHQAAAFANEVVFQKFMGSGGSTLVAVMLAPGQSPLWASAGDSRVYLLSKHSLSTLTVDDTIAGQLNKKGPVPAEHTKILQYVGMGRDFDPHVGEVSGALEGQMALTTDGVHYIADSSDWFRNVWGQASNVGIAAKRLVDVAKWCGGPDNATVALISFPFRPSDAGGEKTDLQIWDAFGELHVQQEYKPSGAFSGGLQSMVRDPVQESRDKIKNDDEPELLENVEPKVSKTTKRRATRKKKSPNRKKTTKTDEVESPQLDIQFSAKSKE